MRRTDFFSMSTDELLDFHEEVAATLARKLIAKKTALEELQKHLSHNSHRKLGPSCSQPRSIITHGPRPMRFTRCAPDSSELPR